MTSINEKAIIRDIEFSPKGEMVIVMDVVPIDDEDELYLEPDFDEDECWNKSVVELYAEFVDYCKKVGIKDTNINKVWEQAIVSQTVTVQRGKAVDEES